MTAGRSGPNLGGVVPLSADPDFRAPGKPATEAHVARVKSGDTSGFAALFDRVAPSLEAWAEFRVTGSLRDYVEPCDVLQEVWWRAMDAIDRYDPGRCSFRTWIFTIATNVLLEWHRNRRRRQRIEPRVLAERAASLPPELARQATSVGRDLRLRETVKKLVDLVSALDDGDRAVFIHCGLEGLTAAESAALTGATAEAAKKRWQRLRERLESNPVWSELLPGS